MEAKPEMRDLIMEIFQTDKEEDLRRIASNARKYERMFQNIPQANIRNAGRKARFTEKDIITMENMFNNGNNVQDIASHFQTSRQTISKYITPSRRINREKFITMRVQFMNENELCTTIDVDFKNKKIYIKNHTNDIIHLAFGVVKNPTWEEFEQFLESRCFPKTRANLKDILRDIGVTSYDPLQIIEKTQGRMAEDKQWIKINYLSKRGYHNGNY